MKNNKTLPLEDFKKLGLYKDGNFTIPIDQVEALKSGRMTDIVEIKGLKGNEMNIDSLPARLSIVKGEDGKPSLRIDPVYKQPKKHPLLTEEESEKLIKSEIPNLNKHYVDKEGNMQTEVIEYDNQTKQFVSFDPRAVKAPAEINGEALSNEKKRKFKEGEIVELADGTQIQIRSSDRKGLRSNRSGLVLSLLLDGGISYLLLTGIQAMVGKKSVVDQAYSQGYMDSLKQVQEQIEKKVQTNPKDKEASKELEQVRAEISRQNVNPGKKDISELALSKDDDKNEAISRDSTKSYSLSGELVDFGNAPFEFKKENTNSFFVKIKNEVETKVIWGVDLGAKLNEANYKIGDKIKVDYLGKEHVKIKVPIKNENGETVSQTEKEVHRNSFEITDLSERPLKNENPNNEDEDISKGRKI